MKDPIDHATLELPLLGMSPPDWLIEAARCCQPEASALQLHCNALQALPKGTSTAAFLLVYQQMLEARDTLYQAWISLQLDEPEHTGT